MTSLLVEKSKIMEHKMKMFRILGLFNLIIGFVGGLIYFIMVYNTNFVFGFCMFIMCACCGCMNSMFCFGFQAIIDILTNINNNLTSLDLSNYKEQKAKKETYSYICNCLEYIVNYLNNKSK